MFGRIRIGGQWSLAQECGALRSGEAQAALQESQ
jgi:hypothetical protein